MNDQPPAFESEEALLRAVGAAFFEATGDRADRIVHLKKRNEVFRIESGGDLFFLKYSTKGWNGYGAATAVSVAREASAWRMMANAGLGAPEVVAADRTCDNPLGTPLLLTRRLPERAFTDWLEESGDDPELFRTLGAFLRRLHAQRFPYAGPLIDGPPQAPLEPDAYHFLSWSEQGLRSWVEETRRADAERIPGELQRCLTPFYEEGIREAIPRINDPRLVHGDCHAHQFLLTRGEKGWRVEGVVDLECAQCGATGPDFAKLFIELIGRLRPGSAWLQPFWEGYGEIYPLDLLRFHLAIFQHINFRIHGRHSWPEQRAICLQHLLRARSYGALCALPRV